MSFTINGNFPYVIFYHVLLLATFLVLQIFYVIETKDDNGLIFNEHEMKMQRNKGDKIRQLTSGRPVSVPDPDLLPGGLLRSLA